MKIPRRKPLTANIGVFGVGHHVYWSQFDGLLIEMHRKLDLLTKRVAACGVTATNFGIVDKAADAYALLPKLKAADLDLVFVDMVTYATSATIGAIFRGLDIPVVLVALQPLPAMDYARGTTFMQLCNDDFCSVPEFTGVAVRLGRRTPPVILGHETGDAAAAAELAEWCQIAKVLHDLRGARIGHLGHVLEAMLDMHTDPTSVTAAFGCHVVQCEGEDILRHYQEGDFTDRKKQLDGLAYYYEGTAGTPLRELVTNLIVGNSLLTGAGFPMCGEFDLKTCIAMLIMDRLDIGGSFAEFHPIDFERDSVLVGHDGPHHVNIADRKPVLRSLKKYHGKPGAGAGVEFQIKEGPITMLSIGVKVDGKFKFVIGEGESVRGPIPPTGNTNTHGKFKPDVRTFLKHWVAEGPTHHFALGIGHHAGTIQKIAECLNIESVII